MPEETIRKLSTRTTRRIILPTIITLLLFVTAIFFIFLPQLEESFLNRKQEMIKELTVTAWSVLNAYHELEQSGKLSRENAQQQAIVQIRNLRYGPENKDYFWINDLHPRMIMHPYRDDLEGTDITGFQDSEGKNLFLEFVKVAEAHGEGYVGYMWQWKDDPNRIVPKLSYIKQFEPWQWIIGTGIYIKDVHAEIAQLRSKLTLVSLLILLVVTLLAIYSIRQTTLADGERLRIFRERERLMKALQESKEKFQDLLETSTDWIWETDKKGSYTYSSPKVKDLLGFEPTEILGKTMMDIVSPTTKTFSQKEHSEMMRNPKPVDGLEKTYLGKNGEIVVLENNALPIFDEDGNFLGYRGIARDITERKMAMEEIKTSRDELHKSLEDTVTSLASTAEKRDPYTAGHQQRVDRLACAIARELGLAEERIEGLHIAALLHDIGKITLPAEYLAKPTKLTKEEQAIVKCHPKLGFDILKNVHFPWPVAEIVYQHHEHLDGSGYPRGLKKDDILPEARILAVADVVEAMSSHRPYRPSLGIEQAFNEIEAGKDTRYDGEVVEACKLLLKEKKFEFCSDEWCPVFV